MRARAYRPLQSWSSPSTVRPDDTSKRGSVPMAPTARRLRPSHRRAARHAGQRRGPGCGASLRGEAVCRGHPQPGRLLECVGVAQELRIAPGTADERGSDRHAGRAQAERHADGRTAGRRVQRGVPVAEAHQQRCAAGLERRLQQARRGRVRLSYGLTVADLVDVVEARQAEEELTLGHARCEATEGCRRAGRPRCSPPPRPRRGRPSCRATGRPARPA